jgi:hypothetical protein
MRIEIQDYTNPAAQAAHLLHDLDSLLDAIGKIDPHLLLVERINGRPMSDILLKRMGRMYEIVIKIEQSRWGDADA